VHFRRNASDIAEDKKADHDAKDAASGSTLGGGALASPSAPSAELQGYGLQGQVLGEGITVPLSLQWQF